MMIEKAGYLNSIALVMSSTVPILAIIFTFLIHIALGYNLIASQVGTNLIFSSLSILITGVNILPKCPIN